jgi:geranylgeranyl diphosphate synthase type II
MNTMMRIENALTVALAEADNEPCPPGLGEAMRYAVFPAGGRIRPRLTVAVATACGDSAPVAADSAAAAIELLHCASLIHDDLPCFDNAATRRGKPAVHVAYGERLAVLAGDALIVQAFQTVGRAATDAPERMPLLLRTISRSVGLPGGIVAGQAWECEDRVALDSYEQAKTGSLFAAASVVGAIAAGVDSTPWRALGAQLGEAYQVADDIRDVASTAEELGKPIGQDEENDRPSAVRQFGVDGAKARLENLVDAAVESIPECPGQDALRKQIRAEAKAFLPKETTYAPA